MATPVRPLPDDFRWRRTHILGSMAFTASDDGIMSNDGSVLFKPFRVGYSNPFPLDWARNRTFTELPLCTENPRESSLVPLYGYALPVPERLAGSGGSR